MKTDFTLDDIKLPRERSRSMWIDTGLVCIALSLSTVVGAAAVTKGGWLNCFLVGIIAVVLPLLVHAAMVTNYWRGSVDGAKRICNVVKGGSPSL